MAQVLKSSQTLPVEITPSSSVSVKPGERNTSDKDRRDLSFTNTGDALAICKVDFRPKGEEPNIKDWFQPIKPPSAEPGEKAGGQIIVNVPQNALAGTYDVEIHVTDPNPPQHEGSRVLR